MKILMILDKPFPTDLRVENEATSLIKAGHTLGLLSIAPYEKSKTIDYKGIKVYQIAVSVFQSKKMHGLAAMIPWMDRFVAKHVLEIFKEEDYDAIHFHDLYMFGAATILKKKTNALMVGDLHENYVDVLKDYTWSTTYPNKLVISFPKWERKEKEWLGLMDKIIVVNTGMLEKTLPKGVDKKDVVIVENMLNTHVFDNYEVDQSVVERFENTFNLLFVGGFISNRGLEHVVDGMALLKDYPDIHLVLVGDGAVKPILESKVKEYGIEDKVHFEGWQTQDKVKTYLMISEIGLVPFKRTPQTDNSSPNKLFQYMYYGLPILSTDCPSIKTVIDEEEIGLIYESENKEQFAEAVIKLYKDEEKRKKFYDNGKNAVAGKYNWDVNVQDLTKMYTELEERLADSV